MIIICKVLRAVPGAKWVLHHASSNPVRLYIRQQQPSSSQPFPVPWWCPSFGEWWHQLPPVSALTQMCLLRIPQGDAQTKRQLCFSQFGPWSFHPAKRSGFTGTQYILFDCIYMVGVKAKIAPDKVKHTRKTIQGCCNRGARPKLSLKSTLLKQSIGGERKIMGQGKVTSHIFTMRGSLVSWSEVPADVRLLLSHWTERKMAVLSALMITF